VKITSCLSRGLALWNEFWFAPRPLLNLALFRVLLCGTMFVLYLSRQSDLTLFFTDIGILPKSLAFEVMPQFYRPPWMLAFWPDGFVPWVHGGLLLCLFLGMIGMGGRVVLWVATYLHLAFIQRNYGVVFGADQIGGIFLMYLSFARVNDVVSVKSWIRGARQRETFFDDKKMSQDLLTSVAYRLIQIQVCAIYAYSGFEKLKGASWWDGTALWSVLANPQFVITDMTWVKHFGLVIPVLSFSTIFFEIYFPILIWVKKIRPYFLAAGVLFHAGIAVLMALYGFALVMICPYILWLQPQWIKTCLSSRR